VGVYTVITFDAVGVDDERCRGELLGGTGVLQPPSTPSSLHAIVICYHRSAVCHGFVNSQVITC